MRSTNSSKLFIDFSPVGRNPGTSGSKTGFELEKREGRHGLGLAGKVRRQASCLLGMSPPSTLKISGRWADSSQYNTQTEGEVRIQEKKAPSSNACLFKMTHILNTLPIRSLGTHK